MLAAIHAANADLAASLCAGRWPTPETRDCFIHRDHHHGNTLWSRGRLTRVVDWNQASWGPGPVDLGHMRWNLALDYGIQAAEEFLAIYRSLTVDAVQHHPYWDVSTWSATSTPMTLCPAEISRPWKPMSPPRRAHL